MHKSLRFAKKSLVQNSRYPSSEIKKEFGFYPKLPRALRVRFIKVTQNFNGIRNADKGVRIRLSHRRG